MMQQGPAAAAAAAAGRVPLFGLAGKRGGAAAALVDYIVVAEFDIDSGRYDIVVYIIYLHTSLMYIYNNTYI